MQTEYEPASEDDELRDETRPQNDDKLKAERKERAIVIGTNLYGRLVDRQGRRSYKEEEWRNAILQYNSQYSATTKANIAKLGGSQMFLNITRPKTDAYAAQMANIALPSDEKNYGLRPTPIAKLAGLMNSTANVGTTPQGNPIEARDVAQGVQQTADERCKAMARVIDDYLSECDFSGEQRKAIEMGVLLGTIIIRGPTKAAPRFQRWEAQDDGQGGKVFVLAPDKGTGKPECRAVDPHHFYPDDTALTIGDCEDVFETFFFTKKRLRIMAKNGFDAEGIKQAIESGAKNLPSWYTNLRNDGNDGNNTSNTEGLFEAWLWHGDLTHEELEALGMPENELELLDECLDSHPAQLWGIGPYAIKVNLNPMETGDLPYSVTQVIKDNTSIFGHGIPWAGANAQESLNAAWRMLHDNAGLSTGSQVVIDPARISGADGDHIMKPRKTWWTDSPDDSDAPVDIDRLIRFIDVPSHMEELSALVRMNIELFDKELNFSLEMQGAVDANTPETKGATQIVNNNGRVVIQRQIKMYDDDIIKPTIRRMYDWEMQNGEDESVKGDFDVIAKGSSVLMERQEQLQAMTQAAALAIDPRFGHMVDADKFIEQYFTNLRLTDCLHPEEKRPELKKKMEEAQAAAAQQGQGDPARMMLAQVAAKRQQADEMESQARLQLDAQIHSDEQTLAAKELLFRIHDGGMTMDSVYQKLGLENKKLDSDNQKFNTETSIKQRMGSGI